MTTQPNRPSHRVYAVSRTGAKSFWREIGAAWSHADGDGFSLKLDYLPLNGAELVIRKPKPADADPQAEAETADLALAD